jgi:hypothetical protein
VRPGQAGYVHVVAQRRSECARTREWELFVRVLCKATRKDT